jgi:hypothetical protein
LRPVWNVDRMLHVKIPVSELSVLSLHSPTADAATHLSPPIDRRVASDPPRAANDEAVVGAGAAATDGDAAAGPGARLLPRCALHPVLPFRRPGCAPRFLSLPRFCTLA